MARETKAAKGKRIGVLLAHYDAKNREANKLNAEVKALKEEIRKENLAEGTYNDMTLTYGTARQQLDQKEARRLLTESKIEIPMASSEPPLVVKPVVK
jgi:hypothetical protein